MPTHSDRPRSPERQPDFSSIPTTSRDIAHQIEHPFPKTADGAANGQPPSSQTPDIKRGRPSSSTDLPQPIERTHPEHPHNASQSSSSSDSLSSSKELGRTDQTSRELVRVSDLPSKELVVYNGRQYDPMVFAQAQQLFNDLSDTLKGVDVLFLQKNADGFDADVTLQKALVGQDPHLLQKIAELPPAFRERINQAIRDYQHHGQEFLEQHDQMKQERGVEHELQRPPLPQELVEELVQMGKNLPQDLADHARCLPAETPTSRGAILDSPELQPLLEQDARLLHSIRGVINEEVQVHDAMKDMGSFPPPNNEP